MTIPPSPCPVRFQSLPRAKDIDTLITKLEDLAVFDFTNFAEILGNGWSSIEEGYVWTCANDAFLRFKLPGSSRERLIELTADVFTAADRLPHQRVIVSINSVYSGETIVGGFGIIEVRVPPVSDTQLVVRLQLPDARRPRDLLAGNGDDRLLGISLRRVSIREVDEIQRDRPRLSEGTPLEMVHKRLVPTCIRETYELFQFYREELGIEWLFSTCSFEGITARQICFAVHDRPPDSLAAATGNNIPALTLFTAAMRSAEFRHNFVEHFLRAYPEKGRLIFIHIPKCAGSDLSSHLSARFPSLNSNLQNIDVIGAEQFFRSLKNLVLELKLSDEIFVHGHTHLSTYEKARAIRPRDKVFSVLRAPRELVLSQINYTLTRIFSTETPISADTNGWRREFSITNPIESANPEAILRLASRILRHPGVVVPNVMCRFLGNGFCSNAIERIVSLNVELTDVSRYSAWCMSRWGVGASTKRNQSKKYVDWESLSEADILHVESIVSEDSELYAALLNALSRTGGVSITGQEILPAVSQEIGTNVVSHSMPTGNPPESPESSEPANSAASPELFDLQINFGIAGNAAEFQGDGWSSPEDGYTWNDGIECDLYVPIPLVCGIYLLRIKVSPFVFEDQLASQQVRVAVNDIFIAAVTLTGPTELRYEVPSEIIHKRQTMVIAFRFETSRRPSELISGNFDRRLLAASFEYVRLTWKGDLRTAAGDGAGKRELIGIAATVPVDKLMMQFESLGENCEFGLVQRLCGAEPLGLLRFSSAPLGKLLGALDSRFEGMGKDDQIEVYVSANKLEYMVKDLRYGFDYHAWVRANEQSAEAVHRRECRRVPFLTDKLIRDLEEGEKIFVFHVVTSNEARTQVELHERIRKFGLGTLLWVQRADSEHPPGTVVKWQPGLYVGYVKRFAPGDDAHDISLGSWISVCRETYRQLRTEFREPE